MSNTLNDSLLAKLQQLQCHFTWMPQRDNIDLDDVKQRLEDSIKVDGIYQGMPHNQLAFVNCLQGNCEEAIQNLKEAEKFLREQHKDEFERSSIITYGNYAWVHYHMGQLTTAQSYLDKLEMICKPLTDGPRYSAMIPEVYGEKGWSLLTSAKYYEEAKECFEKALEENPDDTEWNMGYATVLSRLESFTVTPENQEQSRSVKQLKRVLELDPNNSVAMVLLALKLQEFKQKKEANELVEQALQKSPDLPYVLRYAAKFYRLAEAVEKSIELLMIALKFTPNSAFLHHQIGMCYREILLSVIKYPSNLAVDQKAELISQCKHHFEKAFEMKSSFIIARLDFAGICLINGELQRAEEIFNNLLSLENIGPDQKQALALQAGLFELYNKKSASNAINHFLEGLKIQINSKQWQLCYKKLKMIATKQITRHPNNSVAFGKLGLMHQLAGEKCEATECFEKALMFDPGNEDYLSALFKLRLST